MDLESLTNLEIAKKDLSGGKFYVSCGSCFSFTIVPSQRRADDVRRDHLNVNSLHLNAQTSDSPEGLLSVRGNFYKQVDTQTFNRPPAT